MSTTVSGSVPAPRAEGRKGVLDRFLGIFADVHGGEGITALLLMLNIFLLLASYYVLKTIREPLILAGSGGAEIKSYAAAVIAGLLIVLVPLYSWIASHVSRVKLINGVTLFFIACLIVFFVLSLSSVPVGVPFFVWVGIFNLMIIAQLWAFANDVYSVEQGKRLFAIVGFGASLGAIAGSFLTGKLVGKYGPYPFMLAAAGLLGLCMVITTIVHVREKRHRANRTPTAEKEPEGDAPVQGTGDAEAPVKGKSGFVLVFSDKYLLLIGLLMLLVNLVNTTGEYILGKTVVDLFAAKQGSGVDEEKVIGEFYGNYFTLVNLFSALIQAFVVSRVLKYFGVRVALLVLPVVALIGYGAMAFIPLLPFIRSVKLAENSLDYSLQNTARNTLYLPTSREAKYKAKQANDTFFVRIGDVLSAGLVFAGVTWLGFSTKQFALTNAALVVVWLLLAIAVGVRFKRLSEANSGTAAPAEATGR